MAYMTKQEVLKRWNSQSPEYREKKAEFESLRKDIRKAQALIQDAAAHYRKKVLKAKTLKQAEEDPYKDISDYANYDELHEAYGWGSISEKEFKRLSDLMEKREESLSKGNSYTDRVIQMLEAAARNVMEPYLETIGEFEEEEAERDRKAQEYADRNNQEEYNWTHGIKEGA